MAAAFSSTLYMYDAIFVHSGTFWYIGAYTIYTNVRKNSITLKGSDSSMV